jgi:pyrimidine-nucleoside phosphorylase
MIDQILLTKRDGHTLSTAQIESFVSGVVDGSVSRPQAAALLAFIFLRGLDDGESVALTRAMTDSGPKLSWPGIDGPFVDKHSTGGVGDKVSLVLAPLWAELGVRVPMISGRGLGHTGGTLDKLEAIPGYRCDLDDAALHRVLRDVGCFISGQTAALAPADRILYALRNETQTVACIPLIVASILSKKLAEGLDRLVLDVKVGTGAFMQTIGDARRLAEAMVRVGNGAGVQTRALLTDMSQPLGEACGNALEVMEAIDCLQGKGPADLRALTLALVDHPDAARVLDSGAAFERFARMARAQGGELTRLTAEAERWELLAPRDGIVTRCDAWNVGRAAFVAGAGRLRAEDPVDPAVGVMVHKKVGDRVLRGEALATLWHRERSVDEARRELDRAFAIGESEVPTPPLLIGTVEPTAG